MPTTDTELSNLVINKLTRDQYDELLAEGAVNPNELYVTYNDAPYIVDGQEVEELNGIDLVSSGSNSSILKTSITVQTPIGGYRSGDVIPEGTSYEVIINKIFGNV